MSRRAYPVPRWQTPLPDGVVGSWGPDVELWALTELGIRLDRWQRRVLNRALVYGADGRLLHSLYVASTARQNGKTTLVRSLVGWALTARRTPPWSMIYGLAHDKKQAALPYRAVLADLRPMARRLGPPSRGGLSLTRYLGITSATYGRSREYHTGSREARDALRGEGVDLGLFDEVRTQRDFDTWAALEPTTTARPDPLIVGTSTAGDDRSVLLRAWFDRGRRIIEGAEPANGFGMTWYAPPDDMAPDDPRAWALASPAIADGRLDPLRVRDSIGSLGPAAFRSERLNLWSDAVDEWLPPGLWAATAAAQPDEHRARVVLGVEAVPTWRRVSITVALLTDDGAWVGMAAEIDSSRTAAATVSPAALVALLDQVARAWRPTTVAYSGTAAAAPHVEAWAEAAGVAVAALGPRQLRAASELFRSELIGRRLTHADDPLLARQARAARPNTAIEAGGWYFGVRESTGEIDALRAAAWAAWAAIAPDEPETPANIHV